jgi:hypothetical protein
VSTPVCMGPRSEGELFGERCMQPATFATYVGPRCARCAEAIKRGMKDPSTLGSVLAGKTCSDEDIARLVRPMS